MDAQLVSMIHALAWTAQRSHGVSIETIRVMYGIPAGIEL